jgi:hypothetical protein
MGNAIGSGRFLGPRGYRIVEKTLEGSAASAVSRFPKPVANSLSPL